MKTIAATLMLAGFASVNAAAADAIDRDDDAARLSGLINSYRAEQNHTSLALDDSLSALAREHAIVTTAAT